MKLWFNHAFFSSFLAKMIHLRVKQPLSYVWIVSSLTGINVILTCNTAAGVNWPLVHWLNWKRLSDLLWARDVLKYAQRWTRSCMHAWALLFWLPSIIEPIGICCIINPGRESAAGVKNIPRTTINKIFITFFFFFSFIHSFASPWQAQHLWFIQYICLCAHTRSDWFWLVYKALWKHGLCWNLVRY